MEWDEKGCGTVCGIMFDMPRSQIRAPETHRSSVGVAIIVMEMGENYYGLRGWVMISAQQVLF